MEEPLELLLRLFIDNGEKNFVEKLSAAECGQLEAGGWSGYFGCGVCELVVRDSIMPWYPQECCLSRSRVEEWS